MGTYHIENNEGILTENLNKKTPTVLTTKKSVLKSKFRKSEESIRGLDFFDSSGRYLLVGLSYLLISVQTLKDFK